MADAAQNTWTYVVDPVTGERSPVADRDAYLKSLADQAKAEVAADPAPQAADEGDHQ